MAAAEVETPVKMCLTVIEKKVRNLEKRKGKLDSYREKQAKGEELNKDQLEAIAKYDVVLQNLEFSRDLQKQFQSMGTDMEKLQRKQSKREKVERQQVECVRLQELLKLQTLLDTLGDDAVRQRLKSGQGCQPVSDEVLNQLDEFYQLIAPSGDNSESFEKHVSSAAEHIQLYLDHSDRAISTTTYCALHDLIDRLETSRFLDATALPPVVKDDGNEGNITQNDTHNAEQQQLPHGTTQQLHLSTYTGSPLIDDQSEKSSVNSASMTGSGLVSSTRDSPAANPLSYSLTNSSIEPATSWAAPVNTLPAAVSALSPHSVGQVYENSYYMGLPQAIGVGVGVGVMTPAGVSAGSNNAAADSSTYSQPLSRPIHDIMSSLQGNFHFLQESQIDLENQSILSSVRTSNPVYGVFSSGTTISAPGGASHFTSPPHLSESPGQLNHAPSPLHFTASSSLYHQSPAGVAAGAAAFYSAQHRASPGFAAGYPADQHHAVGAPGGFMSTSVVAAAEEACPVPIPLPSEVGHGQSLTMGTFSGGELANVALSKPPQPQQQYSADIYRSVYESTPGVSNSMQQSSAGSSGPAAQTAGNFPISDSSLHNATSNGLRGSPHFANQQEPNSSDRFTQSSVQSGSAGPDGLDDGFIRAGRSTYSGGHRGMGAGYGGQMRGSHVGSSKTGTNVGRSGGGGNVGATAPGQSAGQSRGGRGGANVVGGRTNTGRGGANYGGGGSRGFHQSGRPQQHSAA